MHSNILRYFCFKHLHVETQFTSKEVVALTRITARQLQWWDERGIVVPERQGRRRIYSTLHVAELAVICDLRRRGFSLQRVRKVMRILQREFGKSLADMVSNTSDYHLLTDGQNIYVETSAKQIVDILKNARQPMLAICLRDMARQVRSEIRHLKKRNGRVLAGRKQRRAS